MASSVGQSREHSARWSYKAPPGAVEIHPNEPFDSKSLPYKPNSYTYAYTHTHQQEQQHQHLQHAFHRQRHHQDHLRRHPPSSGCLPRAWLQCRLPHQHPVDHPWLHSGYHPRPVHYLQILVVGGSRVPNYARTT